MWPRSMATVVYRGPLGFRERMYVTPKATPAEYEQSSMIHRIAVFMPSGREAPRRARVSPR